MEIFLTQVQGQSLTVTTSVCSSLTDRYSSGCSTPKLRQFSPNPRLSDILNVGHGNGNHRIRRNICIHGKDKDSCYLCIVEVESSTGGCDEVTWLVSIVQFY